MRPGKRGGMLKTGNNPGKPGQGGRPASEFRAACRELFDKYKLMERLVKIGYESDDEKASIQAITKLAEWGWVELKRVEVTGKDGEALISLEAIRAIQAAE